MRLDEFCSIVVASRMTLFRKFQAVRLSASIGRREIVLALDRWPVTDPITATMIAIWIDIQNGPSRERTYRCRMSDQARVAAIWIASSGPVVADCTVRTGFLVVATSR